MTSFVLAALLVLHNGTVIDGDVRGNVDIVVDGERIARVGECAHPAGARVIDATGKYVLPGFIDMHVHLFEHGRDEKGEIAARYDRGEIERMLRLLLDHGVTTVRDPGSETEAAVTLRRMLEERKVVGPRLFTAGRIINASAFNPEPFMPVRTADDVRREIRWQAAAGVDFIKVYASMTPELLKVAIDEAHAHKLPVIGHLHMTTWTEAAKLGIDAIAHGAPWAPEYLPADKREAYQPSLFARAYWLEHIDLASPVFRELTDALVRGGVSIDPTLIAYHTKFFGNDRRWLENRDNALVSARMLAGWKVGNFTKEWTAEQYATAQKAWPKQLALTKLLFDRGVLLTVGTDTPTAWIVPGAALHSEMEILVSAGIPPAEVLRMATRNAARSLRRERDLGTIAPGAFADLVVLQKNPLDDIRNTRAIELVIARGRVHVKAP